MDLIDLRQDIDGIEDALVEVAAAAFGDDGSSLREPLQRHPSREDFRIALATFDHRIVGFVYGYTGRRGQWWTDRMRGQIPAELYAEWFEGHYEVVTAAVHPEHQRRGLGARLMQTLVAEATNDRALLSTATGDTPARRLYERLGWLPLADVDDGRTVVMGLVLPADRRRSTVVASATGT